MKRITIYDRRFGKNEHQVLEAYVNDNGDLVFEGQDIGDFVEKYWGNSDYEYWLTVKAEHVPIVLLELIKERFNEDSTLKSFKNDSEFRDWLKEKGIPSEFYSWA